MYHIKSKNRLRLCATGPPQKSYLDLRLLEILNLQAVILLGEVFTRNSVATIGSKRMTRPDKDRRRLRTLELYVESRPSPLKIIHKRLARREVLLDSA